MIGYKTINCCRFTSGRASGSRRTVHDAQAKVKEQASDVAAEPGRIWTRDAHLPVRILINSRYGPGTNSSSCSHYKQTKMASAWCKLVRYSVLARLHASETHLTVTTSSSSRDTVRGLSKLLCRREPLPNEGS